MLNNRDITRLEVVASRHATTLGVGSWTVSVPAQSIDWGFEFHPDYNEVVTEVEIYTSEGCVVLFVSNAFSVVDAFEVPFAEAI